MRSRTFYFPKDYLNASLVSAISWLVGLCLFVRWAPPAMFGCMAGGDGGGSLFEHCLGIIRGSRPELASSVHVRN